MRTRKARGGAALMAVASVALASMMAVGAQGRPRASIDVVLDADGVHAGQSARAALRVALPEGIHVQSSAPHDPFLIATAATVPPTAGVTVAEVVYPPAIDFAQAGQSVPLTVFEQRFAIGLKLAIAPGTPTGVLQVPIQLRYQPCDATTCFAPAREQLTATLHVVPGSTPRKPQFVELFNGLRFSR